MLLHSDSILYRLCISRMHVINCKTRLLLLATCMHDGHAELLLLLAGGRLQVVMMCTQQEPLLLLAASCQQQLFWCEPVVQ
jgi:hypothetical protein